ncbi:MAG: murein biosynthesis integral membrane protein MurJ [Patescibacteria group bacterium]|nr:murein biosynthesis integral membrane protein MurJ [Patescibacteria group bacterium]
MIKKIINLRSKTITFSAVLIAFSTGVSAVLGLLRDRLLVTHFPVGELDVYFAAFRIPDFIYGILITGGIVAVFLPVFSSVFEKSKEEGLRLASNIMNVLLVVLFLICAVLFFITPFIIKFIVPGFSGEELKETIFLTRLMLASPIILGASSLFSGFLQYFERFLAYSLAPIFYNIGIISGIIFLAPHFGLVGVAYGVIFGAVLHLAVQIPPAYFAGFSYKPFIDLKQKELHKVFFLMIPRIIGQASAKINIIIITALASLLTAGSISIFNLANNFQSFPIRIVGVAFAIAAFPAFSRSVAQKRKKQFAESFSKVICQVLFFIIPASVIVFLLRAHIVRLVLGVENFGWRETQLTAACLGIFSFAFFAGAIIHIIVRAFFSFQDTKTPVAISLFAMGTNIILAFFFIWIIQSGGVFNDFLSLVLRLESIKEIEVVAFPLSIFVSSILHLILLVHFFKKKMVDFYNPRIKNCIIRTVFASLVMGVFVYITRIFIENIFHLTTFFAVLLTTSISVLVGGVMYFLALKLVNSLELKEVVRSLNKL